MNSNSDIGFERWNYDSYVSEFLSLRCAGDVLNVCSPIGSKASKEITETMGAIRRIRSIALGNPMGHGLYDLCAGNALTSVLAIHLLPIKFAVAIDSRHRKREWELAKRFIYCFQNIYELDCSTIEKNSIIVSVHPCKKLAERVIQIYRESEATHLILIPCCNGRIKNTAPQEVREKLGKYMLWCWQLAESCNGKFQVDEKILSPKNIVITASKPKTHQP